MEVKDTTLGQVCEAGGGEIQTGPFGSKLHKSDYQDAGTPVVMPSNIEEGRISTDGIARIGGEKLSELQSYQLSEGEIIFGRRGDIGACALVTNREEGWLCGTGCIRVNLGAASVDSTFLRYYLSQSRIGEWLENHAVGSTMANLNTEIISNIPLDLPPLPVQRRIAGILGAYDDFIANNRRRIELLEEMATAIFREWFVHYRFPRHEDVETRETEIGEVPKYWDVVTVPEAIEVNPRIPIPDGEKHYVPMSNVSEDSMVVTHAEMRDQRRGRKFQNGDTLFARITPSLENGKTGFVQFLPSDDDVGVGSGELIGLRSKTLCPEYVYLLARTERFRQNAIKSMTGSAGRQRVKLDCFDNFPIVQPDPDTLDRFENTTRPMFESVQNLVERNQTLRETRDVLLPRLVSGEVGATVDLVLE